MTYKITPVKHGTTVLTFTKADACYHSASMKRTVRCMFQPGLANIFASWCQLYYKGYSSARGGSSYSCCSSTV